MPTNDADNGKCAKATICVRCKHYIHGSHNYPNLPLCAAYPAMNYVTGAPEYITCASLNSGGCDRYEERGDDV